MQFDDKLTLSNICSNINYGYTASADKVRIDGTKLLRITDIQNGSINWSTVPVCDITESDYKKYQLKKGDIVVARTGNTTGENAQIKSHPPKSVFASYLIRFEIDQTKANPFYIGYQLRSSMFTEYVNAIKGGSAQPGANAKQLGAFPIYLIDRAIQNKAVSVLTNLDKKIDLLKQTNKTLESIAQAIFKSWFIDFDPVHAKQQGKECAGIDKATADLFPSSFVESELGSIPKGWVATTIGEVLDRLKTKNRYGKDNLDTYGSIPVYEQGVSILMGYRLGEPEYAASTSNPIVIFGDHTCVTKILFSPFDISSNVIAFKGKSLATSWVYYAIKDKQHFEEYRRHWGELIVKKIVIPNTELCNHYSKSVMPLLSKIDKNEKQISHLSLLRDLLLPRLITGKLDLGNIEEELEGIA